jgi:hypothetical protein
MLQIYRYKIVVETGHWFGSGTTAGIMIRLHGEIATSDAIELVGNGKPVFERGSRDVFLIKYVLNLTNIYFIERLLFSDHFTSTKCVISELH